MKNNPFVNIKAKSRVSKLKKSAKIAIIGGIAVAIAISVLAVTAHLRLSAIEGNENRQESTSEKINEAVNVLTNPNAEHNETSESEKNESSEEHEKETSP